ncbi:MAG: type II secretion system major pseudopilin GspG [Planctomycetes bacterium]|nr:type II secretion system major pseudopilin GspG [Planctomycetota bacterium]
MQIKRSAFSLLEMMVVIAIIGFLAGALVVNLSATADEAAVSTTQNTIERVEQAVTMFKLSKKKYPTTEEGLDALVEDKKLKSYPQDAWGNDLGYERTTGSEKPFRIYSLGADGLDGGDGVEADLDNMPKDEL